DELKETLKAEPKDTDAIKKKLDELNKVVQKASTELYKKTGAAPNAGAGGGANGSNADAGEQGPHSEDKPDGDNVVDADYKVDK
ncbi:MAG: molecular chaperone DnaK, partial [Nitrosopumilus sp. CG10_big_fil_rev_8_21_14_0_10_33_7]